MTPKRVEFINLGQAGSDALTAAARLAAHHHRQGRRVLIVAASQAEAQEMDQRLWTFEQNSFVPHALAGGPDQDQEPVLIATGPDNLNQAGVAILLHPQEPPPYELVILLIPRQEGPELKACRDLYARLRQAGAEVAHITALP